MKKTFIQYNWLKDKSKRLPWFSWWFKKKPRKIEYITLTEFEEEIEYCMKLIHHVVWWDIKKLEQNKLLNILFWDLCKTKRNLYIRDVQNKFREEKEYKKWYFKNRLYLILQKEYSMKDLLKFL